MHKFLQRRAAKPYDVSTIYWCSPNLFARCLLMRNTQKKSLQFSRYANGLAAVTFFFPAY